MIYPNQKTKILQLNGSNNNILGENGTILSMSITTDSQGIIYCSSPSWSFYSFGQTGISTNTQWNNIALNCDSLSSLKIGGTVADIYTITYIPQILTPTQIIQSQATTSQAYVTDTTLNFGLGIIIVLMMLGFVGYIFNRLTSKKRWL